MATYQVRYAGDSDRERWDEYVCKHPNASPYHLFGWRRIIHATYEHDTYYLMSVRVEHGSVAQYGVRAALPREETAGILPLVHIKSILFGNSLVSMPFMDSGGFLADNEDVKEGLLSEALTIGRKVGASSIELRCERPNANRDGVIGASDEMRFAPLKIAKRFDKARMLLNLPASPAELTKSFKSKLRSQIKRPLKEGCTSSVGGLELLDDFYRAFLINMRDLGSPVHSKNLMRHVLGEFSERSKIFVIYYSGAPVASALVIGLNNVLRNPWASSDRKYAFMSPNMLLYLRMLEFACDNGYEKFDFGRSTINEGTYRFKEQWGAVAVPLDWYLISLDRRGIDLDSMEKRRFHLAARCWRKLPLAVTKVIGPQIRKYISL